MKYNKIYIKNTGNSKFPLQKSLFCFLSFFSPNVPLVFLLTHCQILKYKHFQVLIRCSEASALDKQHFKTDFLLILSGTSFQAFKIQSIIIDANAL